NYVSTSTGGRQARVPYNAETYDVAGMLAAGRNVYGNPDQCIKAINRTLQNYDFDIFSTTFNFGGLPHEDVKRSMRLFAKEVMPAFKDVVPPMVKEQAASAPEPVRRT